jgi:hypothetical protein
MRNPWPDRNGGSKPDLYDVIMTDVHGVDYTTSVALTPLEAQHRIVNGRLISEDEARRRNYAASWEKFKAMAWNPGGGSDDTAWQSRNLLNEAKEKGQI